MRNLVTGRPSGPTRPAFVQMILVVGALLITACGTDAATDAPDASAPEEHAQQAPAEAADDSSTATGDDFPVELGGIVITQRPERIVSISPTSTEMLFAIGAGDQVVAVDEYSTYPSEAPVTDLSGFQPNIEAIAEYEPDLVLADRDPGGLVDSLGVIDVPVLLQPAAETFDDVFEQLELLGRATGHVDGAAATVEQMQTAIDEVVAEVAGLADGMTYFHELDPTYYSVTSSTFIGEVYGVLGLTSIADAVDDDAGGYPQLSPEYIVEADPDIIFLADAACCGVTADDVAARPGWETITAVQTGAIVELDEDVASRWGPRIVELLRMAADAVAALADHR